MQVRTTRIRQPRWHNVGMRGRDVQTSDPPPTAYRPALHRPPAIPTESHGPDLPTIARSPAVPRTANARIIPLHACRCQLTMLPRRNDSLASASTPPYRCRVRMTSRSSIRRPIRKPDTIFGRRIGRGTYRHRNRPLPECREFNPPPKSSSARLEKHASGVRQPTRIAIRTPAGQSNRQTHSAINGLAAHRADGGTCGPIRQ